MCLSYPDHVSLLFLSELTMHPDAFRADYHHILPVRIRPSLRTSACSHIHAFNYVSLNLPLLPPLVFPSLSISHRFPVHHFFHRTRVSYLCAPLTKLAPPEPTTFRMAWFKRSRRPTHVANSSTGLTLHNTTAPLLFSNTAPRILSLITLTHQPQPQQTTLPAQKDGNGSRSSHHRYPDKTTKMRWGWLRTRRRPRVL